MSSAISTARAQTVISGPFVIANDVERTVVQSDRTNHQSLQSGRPSTASVAISTDLFRSLKQIERLICEAALVHGDNYQDLEADRY